MTRVSLGFATGQFTLLPSTLLEQLPAAPRLASELRGQAQTPQLSVTHWSRGKALPGPHKGQLLVTRKQWVALAGRC